MEVLNRIRSRFLWVLLLTIVGLGGSVAYGYTTTAGYNATATLFVGSSAHDAVEAAQGNIAGQDRAKTYAVLGAGSELLERAADRSDTGVSGSDLASRLRIVAIPDTVLVEVTVKASNPDAAASQADAVADELIDLVSRVEAPINGGDPALGLIVVQPAKSSVVEAGMFDYKTLAMGAGIGLVVGLILTGAIGDRRQPQDQRHEAKRPDRRDDGDSRGSSPRYKAPTVRR
jgi:capsular polysaccharide biosynthesis protein